MEIEKSLDDHFQPVITVVETVSAFLDTTGKDFSELTREGVDFLDQFPQIVGVHSTMGNNTCFTAVKRGNRWSTSISSLDNVKVASDGCQTTEILETMKWSSPYFTHYTDQPVISVVFPIQLSGEFRNIVKFDIDLRQLEETFEARINEASGILYLMTSQREMVSVISNTQDNSEKQRFFRKQYPAPELTGDRFMKPVSETDFPLVSRAIEEWGLKRQGHSKEPRHPVVFFGRQPNRYVGAIRNYELPKGGTFAIWYLTKVNRISQLEPYTRHLILIPIIACLALGFAILLSKKTTRRYLQPLEKLVRQSVRISQMDLTKGTPIESDILELQQLADSQEQMRNSLEESTTNLRISNEKLEELGRTLSDKVEERTRELKLKSDELSELNKTLAEKVRIEVEASSRKDKIMFQSARQAQMGEMISMIAHQWRQPLSSISTVTGNMLVLLELDSFEKEEFRDLLSSINDHAQYLSSTINDFRNFFKPNKEKQSVMLDDILEQTINIIGKSLEYKSIRLTTDLNFSTPLTTYPNELTQVFLNIIKNAQDVIVDKKTPSPKISVKGSEANGEMTVIVADNAGGIDAAIIDKIFEPYFSTKDEKTGTGLGLYMSKLIVEQHCQGKLTVTNGDEGAIFTVILPEKTETE